MSRDFEDEIPEEDPFDDPAFANAVDALIETDFGSLDDPIPTSDDPSAPGVFPESPAAPYPPALDGPAEAPFIRHIPTGLI